VDPINLDDVAEAMHVSTFYFCKMFKEATGLTFTEYLGRVRIEQAKAQLLNPNWRVSEIAFDVGTVIFRQLARQSLTEFRVSRAAKQMLVSRRFHDAERGKVIDNRSVAVIRTECRLELKG
jgi:YesN/AraC family two-component response regulator